MAPRFLFRSVQRRHFQGADPILSRQLFLALHRERFPRLRHLQKLLPGSLVAAGCKSPAFRRMGAIIVGLLHPFVVAGRLFNP